MAQSGYTPILIYSSSTASNLPSASNLTNSTLGSELAINIADGKLFYKDTSNAVQVIGWKTTPTTAGGTGLTSYTAGDLLYYATGTTLSKLAIGASTTILTSSGTAPQWSAASGITVGTATNIAGGAAGSVPYQTGAGATSLLAIGTAYYMLGVNAGGTAPSWQPSSTSTLTAQGDLLYASAANTLARLAKNTTATRYLSNTGSSNNPAWAQIDLTNGVTGTLPVGNGGTGQASWTTNGLLYASATTTLTNSPNITYDGTTFTTIATQNFKGVFTTLGNSAGQANNAAILRFNGWNTGGANWQIDTANISSTNELAFTPSTAAGGLTFTTLSQSFRSNGTIGVGTSGSTSGSGITFPATQSASTDANTLDDYEEGTFTITGEDQSGNGFPSYTTRTAYYTKIGRLVHVTIYLRTNADTTGMTTGQQLKITGLPFTPLNNTVNYVHAAAFLTALSPATYFELLALQSGTSLDIYSTGGDASAPYDPTAFTVANFENGNGAGININFAYPIA